MKIMMKSITLASPEDHLTTAVEVLSATQGNIIPSLFCSTCTESNLKGTKNIWDYPNKTYKGKKYQLRKLAFITKTGRLPYNDVSHKCSNARCFAIDHVVDEPNDLNQTRKCCKTFLGNPLTPSYVCPHELMGYDRCVPSDSK